MSNAFAKFKPLLTLLIGVLSTLGVLSLTRVGPAQAQSPGVNLATPRCPSQRPCKRRTRPCKAGVAAVEGKTAPLSVSGTDLTITGVNVHIVDGSGSTDSTSGLGNLIVGYNAPGNRGATSAPAATTSSWATRTATRPSAAWSPAGDQQLPSPAARPTPAHPDQGAIEQRRSTRQRPASPRSAAATSNTASGLLLGQRRPRTTWPAASTPRSAAATATRPAAPTPR